MISSKPVIDTRIIKRIKDFYIKKNNIRELLLFLLAINTGLKLNELLALNIKDVKNKDVLVVKQNPFNKVVPLNEQLQKLILKICGKRKSAEPLFTTKNGSRLDRTSVFRSFKKACDELGLDKNISVASWRKTFGYHYYQANKDLLLLQWWFNQTSVRETMKYIGIQEDMNSRFDTEFCL